MFVFCVVFDFLRDPSDPLPLFPHHGAGNYEMMRELHVSTQRHYSYRRCGYIIIPQPAKWLHLDGMLEGMVLKEAIL